MNLSKSEIVRTEKYILIAMSISVGYEIIQFFANSNLQSLLPFVNFLNHALINSSDLSSNRFQGFAREPAWLADQILLLYLPLSLSMILSEKSYGRLIILKKSTPIRTEYFHFFMAVFGIFLAASRVGFFGFFLLILAALFYSLKKPSPYLYKIYKFIFFISFIFMGFLFALNHPYSNLVINSAFNSDNFIIFANRSSFAPRLSLWLSALDVIKDNFITGIGINQFSFFYPHYLQDWALASPEVLAFLEMNDINSKQFFLKIFLDGGFVGFLIFSYFLFRHFTGSRGQSLRSNYLKTFILLSLIITSFEFDSYALPNFWFALSLCKLIKD